MTTFLQQTAQYLHDAHHQDYKKLLILTPNRRAGLFLQKELQALSDQPIWAPVMMTMDEWVQHHSLYVPADRLSAIYALYDLWTDYFSAEEPFENFYFWGQRVLDDFDQIDKYLVPIDKLFTNLSDEKKIDEQFSGWKTELLDYLRQFWSSIPEIEEDSHDGIALFHTMWAALPQLKAQLDQRLAKQGTAYSGHMYRQLATTLKFDEEWSDYDIYFVGFNRLNSCEQRIMERMKETHGAQAIWNVETNLLPPGSFHNAGMYLRSVRDGQDNNIVFSTDWTVASKTVSSFGVQKKVAQAKWIGEQLAQVPETAEETMIILPDEQMLLPLLSALPEEIEHVNVSMGVSLSETPAASLLATYLEMHQNYAADHLAFRTQDVQALTDHPYMPELKALDFSHARMRLKDLHAGLPESMRPFFKPLAAAQPVELFDHLLLGIKNLHAHHSNRQDTSVGLAEYISEVLVFTHQRIQKLADIYRTQSMALELDALGQLIQDYFRHARIPFQGEPLKGLQILGSLEARNLDYKHLFIPNLNEGVFPRGGDNSLIPFHLKKAFGMPVVDDEIAESAYYFFMALSRAQTIHLLYNESMDVLGAREQSRFVQSLTLFTPDNWKLSQSLQVQKVEPKTQAPIVIEKTDAILSAIRTDLQTGLSPSKLRTILQCHLRYYRHYISKIKEPDIHDRSYSPLNIGNLLHDLLEKLYEPFKGKKIKANTLDEMQERIDGELRDLMIEDLKVDPDQIERGELLLLYTYVRQAVQKILDYDRGLLPFEMVDHEVNMGGLRIPIKIEGLDYITLTGKIDRVDIVQGYYRFSDYKTGVSGFSQKSAAEIGPFSKMMEPDQKDYHDLAIQLGIYAWANHEAGKYQDRSGIQIGHYVIPEMHDPAEYDDRFHIGKAKEPLDLAEHYSDIRESLTQIIGQLLDPETPIVQTSHTNHCSYCPFQQLCKRQDAGWF